MTSDCVALARDTFFRELALEYQLVPTSEPAPLPQAYGSAHSASGMGCHGKASASGSARSLSWDGLGSAGPLNNKETVLKMMLALSDEDVCWMMACAMRNRPALETLFESHKGRHVENAFDGFSTEANFDDAQPIGHLARVHFTGQTRGSVVNRAHAVMDDVPVVQFKAPIFYVSEGEINVHVQVLRVGTTARRSEVRYTTEDDSAKDGKVYRKSEGTLVFEVGEALKAIYVELIDNDEWNPNREFIIKLLDEGLLDAKLDKYLWHTRVLVIDDDPFPTQKYSDYILDDKLDDVSNVGLVIEYAKMQWHNDHIRWASKKIIFADMLDNLHYLAKAILQMYLVDSVLNVHVPETELYFTHNRHRTLVYIAVIIVAPHAIVHFLELQKPFGVGSRSRKLLQKNLFDRFLNCSPSVDVAEGDLLMAMSRDSLAIVGNIYRGMLHMVELIGRVVVICTCQFLAPLIFDRPIHWFSLIPLCVLPVLMIIFLALRDRTSTAVLLERLRKQDACIAFVTEALQSQPLIEEFNARNVFLDRCGTKIDEYHHARVHAKRVIVNNKQFAEWLSTFILAFYTLWGGWAVIEGNLLLGLYVTNLNMFQGMGRVYADIYLFVLSIQEVTPGLKRLTRLMNVPTDLITRAEMSQHHHKQADRLIAKLASGSHEDVPLIDQLPICVGGVTLQYESGCSIMSKIDWSQGVNGTQMLNFHGHMSVVQSQLVQLIGPPGEGKTTLLKLIGGVLLPKLCEDIAHSTDTLFFVPPHLNSIYVPSQPMFFRGSLHTNLTLGVKPGSSDGSPERVAKICHRLGLSESVSRFLEDDSEESWLHHLSHTELALLSVARVLVANPQLLCIERHFMGFDEKVTKRVLHLLREHVDSRGIEEDNDLVHLRRPRSCVMTGSDRVGIELIDVVFSVTHAKGIQQIIE